MAKGKENQPKEENNTENLVQIHEALKEAYDWMQNWYQDFQKKTGFSPEAIASRFKLAGKIEFPTTITIQTEKGPAVYEIFDFKWQIQSEFGPVSMIRLTQKYPHSAPAGVYEGMTVLTPVGDFSKTQCISFGLRFDEPDVLYVNLSSQNGKIVRIAQLTRPGVLFEGPIQITRENSQMFWANFEFSGNNLKMWDVSISDEERGRDVSLTLFSNGDRLLIGPKRHQYIMPENVDIAKAVRNITSGKPAISK